MSHLKNVSLLLFLNFLALHAQDTLYFNSSGEKVKKIELADYYQTPFKLTEDAKSIVECSYYLNGQIREEIHYLDKSKKKKEGLQRFWYRNGPLKFATDFVDNKLHGNVLSYWQNGQLKRKDDFANGNLVEGVCYDSVGRPVEHYDFMVMPSFPGGEKKLLEFIHNNLKYPSQAAENGIGGKVVVKFIIAKDGTPIKFGIKTSVNKALDMEAMRVLQAMPKWSPFYLDGEAMEFSYLMPIVYKMMGNQNNPLEEEMFKRRF